MISAGFRKQQQQTHQTMQRRKVIKKMHDVDLIFASSMMRKPNLLEKEIERQEIATIIQNLDARKAAIRARQVCDEYEF